MLPSMNKNYTTKYTQNYKTFAHDPAHPNEATLINELTQQTFYSSNTTPTQFSPQGQPIIWNHEGEISHTAVKTLHTIETSADIQMQEGKNKIGLTR
jgi:hypothetical protein